MTNPIRGGPHHPCGETRILKPQPARPPWPGCRRLRVPRAPRPPRLSLQPITPLEPRVTLLGAGKPVFFLIDTGATYSALREFAGQTHPSQVSTVGIDGIISNLLTVPSPNCLLPGTTFSYSFLLLPRCPTPILSRDVLSKFRAALTLLTPLSFAEPSLTLLIPHPDPDMIPLPSSILSPRV